MKSQSNLMGPESRSNLREYQERIAKRQARPVRAPAVVTEAGVVRRASAIARSLAKHLLTRRVGPTKAADDAYDEAEQRELRAELSVPCMGFHFVRGGKR